MARMVSSSGFSRRSRPWISAPMCLLRGMTSKRVRVSTLMAPLPARSAVTRRALLFGRLHRVVRRLAVLDFAVGQRGENLRYQLARGGRAQFHRHAIASAIRFADEVDAERMIERRVEGMIVIDVRGVDAHPAVRSLGAAQELGLLDDVRAHAILLAASGGAGGGRRGQM